MKKIKLVLFTFAAVLCVGFTPCRAQFDPDATIKEYTQLLSETLPQKDVGVYTWEGIEFYEGTLIIRYEIPDDDFDKKQNAKHFRNKLAHVASDPILSPLVSICTSMGYDMRFLYVSESMGYDDFYEIEPADLRDLFEKQVEENSKQHRK